MEDFLPLSLGNSDLIIGIQWLEKLSTMTANSEDADFEVPIDGETFTLVGDPTLGRSGISLEGDDEHH